jgi:hypothetical protein
MEASLRPAYTLLEIVVAVSIGMIILGALYWAIESQLSHADTARDVIEQSTLARSLCQKIEADVERSLGTLDPARVFIMVNPNTPSGPIGGQSGGGAGTTPGGGGTTRARSVAFSPDGQMLVSRTADDSASKGSGSGTGSSTSKTPSQNSWSVLNADGQPTSMMSFNIAVQGTSDSLVIYISRAPRLYATTDGSNGLTPNGNADAMSGPSGSSQALLLTQQTSDIRQVTYQMGNNSNGEYGLTRQEVVMVQGDDGSGTMITTIGSDVSAQLLSSEVLDIEFRYLDNDPQNGDGGWVENWPTDATDYNVFSDSRVPIGPPLAIEITMTIQPHSSDSGRTFDPVTYRHVIPIICANGPSLQTLGSQLPQGGNSSAQGGKGS